MTRPPTFDEILAVMTAASSGDREARVFLPDVPQANDAATRVSAVAGCRSTGPWLRAGPTRKRLDPTVQRCVRPTTAAICLDEANP